jgi:hypothetical protein
MPLALFPLLIIQLHNPSTDSELFQVDAELKDFEAEDERGEYAPVVVDMDEDGRERDLIRF